MPKIRVKKMRRTRLVIRNKGESTAAYKKVREDTFDPQFLY